MSTKEQYWKYSLIVIILFMGVIIFRQITPFLGGLLGALTIYILVRGQMNHLVEKRKLKRSISALLITAETIFVFLIPLGLTVWMVANKLQDINLDPQTYIAPIQQVAEFIKEKTGYDVLGKDTLSFIMSILPRRVGSEMCIRDSTSPYRTNYNGKHQQPCHQPVRHDFCALLHADWRKKDGSLCQ